MKRRIFLRKTGALLIQTPIALSVLSITSCKKEASIVPPKGDPPPVNNGDPIVPDNKIIDGYVTLHSYLPGQKATVFLSAKETIVDQSINVYDINGRLAFAFTFKKIYKQSINEDAPYENGYGYLDGLEFTIPAQIKGGVYLIANQIPFIVKNLNATDFTVVYPSNTENAYCKSGGRSLYTNPVSKKVSILRPIKLTFYAAGFLKWLDRQGYIYNIISDMDMEDYTNCKGKLLVVPGHSEYWTRKARNNFDKFVDEGKDAVVISGNTMWWQVRYNADMNQMICYKTGDDPARTNPLNNTLLWTDKSLKYQTMASIGADFNGGGYGSETVRTGWKGYKVLNPGSPLFRGLQFRKGDVLHCPTLEYDGAPIKGFGSDGFPIINNDILGFNKVELVGYDIGYRNSQMPTTVATPMIFKKTATSGTIANMASTDWGTEKNFLIELQTITSNILNDLLAGRSIFST